MITCLVTDRRRVDPVAQARQAVSAGVDLIQIRERDLAGGALAALVSAVLSVARKSSTRVVVNDRLDVALGCGADGVHLRGDSITVADARRLGPPPFLVGRSVHSAAEAAAADGADYVIAGTVFATGSKSEATRWLGPGGLRAIAAVSAAPVLAIGGVTRDRLAEVAATGAAGVAGIGIFMAGSLADIVTAAHSAFDRLKARP